MAARPHRWRRALLWLALTLLLAGLASAGYAWLWWQHARQAQGIVGLDWQGLVLSRHGLRLERLELQQLAADGRRLQLAAQALQLDWRLARRSQRLERLHIERLQLDWQAPASPTGRSSRLPSADELAGLLAWLPRQLQVQRIDARLPCPAAPCRLGGSLTLQHPGAALLPARLQLALQEGAHRLRLDASLDGPRDDARLQLALSLDEQPHLAVAARRHADTLQGSLQLPARPPTPWLLQWLTPMFGAAVQPLARLPDSLQLDADWILQLPAAWHPQDGLPTNAQLTQARLQARLPRLRLGAVDLRELRAELALSGQWQARGWQLTFAPGSRLAARRLRSPDSLRLDDLRAELDGQQLRRGADGALQLAGPLTLHSPRLQLATLRPQAWHGEGRLIATLQAFRLDGRLRNDAGLALDLQLQRPPGGPFDLDYRLEPLDLAEGNPLAATLSAWPPHLELAGGRLAAHGSLRVAAGQAPRADLELLLEDLDGIYARSELRGLDARLSAELHERRLYLELPVLHLARFDAGIPLDALQLRADYQAALDAPLAGSLRLWHGEGELLGGQLRAEPARLELGRPPLRLAVAVRGLQVAELLKVYPAEGLSGSGLVDGRLPLRLDAAGLHIDQGRLAARPPGGVLQLRSPRLRALGQSTAPLRLAARALEDFRYDLLDSQVSYAPQGKMLLVLRLHGSNPALEGGRPVNFTINLEEDIRSLLTSLQLSGRVNEAIQRRVQRSLPPRN